jgi:prepilin-type processing-associated H-X9-DG protein
VERPFAIVPTADGLEALLVCQDALRGYALVRRLDATGTLGSIRPVAGRFVAGGLSRPAPLLVTSDGDQLCVEPWAAAAEPACHRIRPRSIVPDPEGLTLIGERLVEQPEPEAGSASTTKRPATGQIEPPPQEVEIWLQKLDLAGRAAGDPVDTGLAFPRPMPGMALVDAVRTRSGVRMLWYEHAPSIAQGGKRVRRARLRTGRLGEDGRYLPVSRSTLFEGERNYGFVDGHVHPRLFSRNEQVVYVGRFVTQDGRKRTTGFEGFRLRPKRSVDVSAALAGVDPFRLADVRQLSSEELAAFEAIWTRQPTLSPEQPRWEAEHVAWVGERGYFLADGRLHSAARSDGAARVEPAPFATIESRLTSAAWDRTGAGLAWVEGAWVTITPAGAASRSPAEGAAADGNGWDAGLDVRRPRPVRIGRTWWALGTAGGTGPTKSGYQVVRLVPGRLEPTGLPPGAHPDGWVLVGGEQQGLVMVRRATGKRGMALELWQLPSDGAASRLGLLAVAMGAGFDAVPRAAGGAIVAGWAAAEPNRAVLLAVDGRGSLVGRSAVALPFGDDAGQLQLRGLPSGGALLTTARRSHVAWLDDDGRLVAHEPWPAGDSGALCRDGNPAPRWIPRPQPGEFVRVDALAATGACLVGAEQWAVDGSLRWFGATSDGLTTRAEVGVIGAARLAQGTPGSSPSTSGPGPLDASASSVPIAALAPRPSASPPTPCPPDMVSVEGQLCVDRFEARLMDAASGEPLSPDYPATPKLSGITLRRWIRGRWRSGDLHAQALPLPPLGRAVGAAPTFAARSLHDVRPSGYLTGIAAAEACQRAGKRLCRLEEFVRACRGQEDRKFPYGPRYRTGACNVHRPEHPAHELHGNAATGHLDPRLNRVRVQAEPLLRRTGQTPGCRSRWGDDAIFDMVGNLDEWVADKKGTFAGGFYSRGTRKGCDAVIKAHPRRYLDYSLGVRCCLDAHRWPGAKQAPSQIRD